MRVAEERYHHGSLRESLIEKATDVVEKEGWDAVNMRALARDLGVSSGAPFRHFKDKGALISEVAERALQRLDEVFRSAAARAGNDPLERFRAVGVDYVVFAAEHPELFRLIHNPDFGSTMTMKAFSEAEEDRGTSFQAMITAAQEQGMMADADPELIMLAGVALTHGLARLIVDGSARFQDITVEEARELADALTGILSSGLRL